MSYTVKQFGMRLDGKFGLCGEISGLTHANVISQIESLQEKWKHARTGEYYGSGLYHGNDMLAIFDENGKQHTMKEFLNP